MRRLDRYIFREILTPGLIALVEILPTLATEAEIPEPNVRTPVSKI